VIVKNFFHFRLYYALHCFRNLYVKTQGITDFDQILSVKLNGPAWPRDPLNDWHAEDQRRRGLNTPTQPAPLRLGLSPRRQRQGLFAFAGLVLCTLGWWRLRRR
jgi:hypothetical protein